MKKVTGTVRLISTLVLCSILVGGCLIREVKQSTSVKPGGEFQATLTITDKSADANAHEGVLLILVPDDWKFTSGTYSTQAGAGKFVADVSKAPVYGYIDTVIVPPSGMKWIKLITDAALTNSADAIHEATVKLQAGTKTGSFNIGYLVTKNSTDMLKAINPADTDNDQAWADTSMNHKVTVSGTIGVEGQKKNIPGGFELGQNYPNPFNPSTSISFSVPKASNARLTVFNSIGQKIAVLFDGFTQAGMKTVRFNAENTNSGMYYYKLEAGGYSDVKKMMFVK